MRVRAALAVTTVLAALAAVPASAGASGWDITPLPLSGQADLSPPLGPIVESTDDGGIWVMWVEGPGSGPSDVVVRRVRTHGVPGGRRLLPTARSRLLRGLADGTVPGRRGSVSCNHPAR